MNTSDVLIVVMAVWLVWYLSASWRRERRERRQVEWDAYIEQALAVSETPIYDELTVAQFRAELDAWGDRR